MDVIELTKNELTRENIFINYIVQNCVSANTHTHAYVYINTLFMCMYIHMHI